MGVLGLFKRLGRFLTGFSARDSLPSGSKDQHRWLSTASNTITIAQHTQVTSPQHPPSSPNWDGDDMGTYGPKNAVLTKWFSRMSQDVTPYLI